MVNTRISKQDAELMLNGIRRSAEQAKLIAGLLVTTHFLCYLIGRNIGKCYK